MCYCRPEVRTPFCPSCPPKMYADLQKKDREIDELCKIVERLCDGVDRLTAKMMKGLDNRGKV